MKNCTCLVPRRLSLVLGDMGAQGRKARFVTAKIEAPEEEAGIVPCCINIFRELGVFNFV